MFGWITCLSIFIRPGIARADDKIPVELEGVGVVEHRGESIPLDLRFIDENGLPVTLRQYFTTGRPVILNLAYYSCPMLCTMVLNGLVMGNGGAGNGLRGVAWSPGTDFEVISVSIDPRDTPAIARAKKANYLKAYGRPETADGWHFLTGAEADIKTLTRAVGFSYRWDERQQQFAHAAVIFMLTPEGKISRYLYGIEYSPRDLRLGLMEASQGKIGSALEQILLFCYHYDPVSRKYALYATNLMRLGGCITALLLSGLLAGYWRRERRMGQKQSVPISGGVHGAQ
jgi:protein SCO1/2